MSKEILSTNGEKLGEIALNEAVFGVEPNLHVMHLALRRQLNNARQGSASCKTRAEVSGGGKKPWKQKGTGRARAGSLRSPLFTSSRQCRFDSQLSCFLRHVESITSWFWSKDYATACEQWRT